MGLRYRLCRGGTTIEDVLASEAVRPLDIPIGLSTGCFVYIFCPLFLYGKKKRQKEATEGGDPLYGSVPPCRIAITSAAA